MDTTRRRLHNLAIVLVISLSVMIDHKSLLQANGQQQQETTSAISLVSSKTSSSAAASKGSRGYSRFRENIQFMKNKQQAQLLDLTINKTLIKSTERVEQPVSNQVEITANYQQQVKEELINNEKPPQAQSLEDHRFEDQSNHHQVIYGQVEGVPGVDFPGLTSIPNTKFSCSEKPYEPGMYADESTGCQVYHLCFDGRRESFLCSVGTVFNQANLACDFWNSVDCSKSSQYYNLNVDFGKSSSEPGSSSFTSSQKEFRQVNRPLPIKSSVASSQQVSSNFVSNQQLSVTPQRLSKTFESSRESSSLSLPSLPATKSTGKTSLSSSQQARFLSPGRQVKLMNHLSSSMAAVDSSALINSESSNQVKMTSSEGSVGSALTVTTGTSNITNLADSKSFTGEKVINTQWQSKGQVKGGASVEDNSLWRPYSKSASKSLRTSTTTSSSSSTSTPSGTTSTASNANEPTVTSAPIETSSETITPPASTTTTTTIQAEVDLPATTTLRPELGASSSQEPPDSTSTESPLSTNSVSPTQTEQPPKETDEETPATATRASSSSVEYATDAERR